VRSRTRPGERGAGAIVMIGVVGVGCLLVAGATRLGVALVAQARADAAADAAVLAAADHLALGAGADGARAAAVATAADNGAELVRCDCGGRYPEVEVRVAVPMLGAARATARAEVSGLAGIPPP
jgi:hypothetical protein